MRFGEGPCCLIAGEGGAAGDVEPGEGPAEGGFLCRVFGRPPHCDMKERTVGGERGATLATVCSKGDDRGMMKRRAKELQRGAIFTSLGTTHGSDEREGLGT